MPKMNLGALAVTSPAFAFDGPIPTRHVWAEENLSPQLDIANVPAGTEEIVVICHDPDAPFTDGFTHWVLTGLDPSITSLAEGTDAGVAGVSDFGDEGYGGPAPPAGHGTHHYFFHVYAVDRRLGLGAVDRATALAALDGHIIEQARLVGTFQQ